MRIKSGPIAVPVPGTKNRLLPLLILQQGSVIGIPGLLITPGFEFYIQEIVHAGKNSEEILPDLPCFPADHIHQNIIVELFLFQETLGLFFIVISKGQAVSIGGEIKSEERRVEKECRNARCKQQEKRR